MLCLDKIRTHYADNPYGFEKCAKDILEKMDDRFQDFNLTRPWRDGGRDALGYYVIGNGSKANYPLRIDCALEAKCYSPKNSVGVREMSRLISRIRYRQFGVMLTTSYVHKQAYEDFVDFEKGFGGTDLSYENFLIEFNKGYGKSDYVQIARLFELSDGIYYDNYYCM